MSDKNKKNNENMINDDDIEQVTGGGILSSHSLEEFEAAGVEVKGWGWLYNDSYKLKSTGEDLEMGYAHWAVIFFKEQGRPAKSRAEIIAYNEAYNSGSSWTDSGNWG